MARTSASPAKLYKVLRWVPVLVYFVVKYLVFGNELTRTQWIGLIAFVVLAELALWAYQRQHRRRVQSDTDGTNQTG